MSVFVCMRVCAVVGASVSVGVGVGVGVCVCVCAEWNTGFYPKTVSTIYTHILTCTHMRTCIYVYSYIHTYMYMWLKFPPGSKSMMKK